MRKIRAQVTQCYLVDQPQQSNTKDAATASSQNRKDIRSFWLYITWRRYEDGTLTRWEYHETADEHRTIEYVSDEIDLGSEVDATVLASIPVNVLNQLGLESNSTQITVKNTITGTQFNSPNFSSAGRRRTTSTGKAPTVLLKS